MAASVTRSAGVGGVMQPAPASVAKTATSVQSLRISWGYQHFVDWGK
jgi:hypothetical protein